MELLLKLTGNSESLVLQIYDIDTKEWKERISLEKVEKGFFVKSKIANLEYHTNNNITSNERLLAWSDKEPIKYYQKKFADNLLEKPFWHNYLESYGNMFTITFVPSGTKGRISPVYKNSEPVGVFAVSDFSTAGKRNISLYIDRKENIDELLMLYIFTYLNSFDYLKIDMLEVKYNLFYAFSGRKKLTKKHMDMLPKSKRPTTTEKIIWYLISFIIIIIFLILLPKYVIMSLILLLIIQLFEVIINIRRNKNG
ncbi:hypothetical protein B8V60_05250 [Streptococcus agalactiae]|nr:hypothetical protein [Streptococcus agalactiae]KAF1108546.1 hypothetical protein B8V09_02550 [Streptococcus agalactiae]KAF1126675.1 hypothetical protein B8U92_05175 [Streptococcus agalactiae]KAF1137882.1 hypothetical protein B8V14_08620 [Streptococcus agalactiae]KAF1144727.1 hypothetical protein B8V13_05990 [Streptococcus agalactiae]KAF1145066.1 hypothetical protein B8V16_07905 [Streptococcus agalactiae]